VKAELAEVGAKLDATEKQLKAASSKGKSLKDKLRTKDECLSATQAELAQHKQLLQQYQQQMLCIKHHSPQHMTGNWQQQQQQLDGKSEEHPNSSSTSNDSSCDSRPSDGSKKLLLSYQQRVSMLEKDVLTARSQLLQAEQQLEQQKQINGVQQQQLTAVQQQLVQAQQLLLELPKQLVNAGSALQQQQQHSDHVHMAVRSSIQGLQELLQLQSKLQHSQQQAETGEAYNSNSHQPH
jgi:hypothetical protein